MSTPENTSGLTSVEDLFTYHIFGLPGELEQWQDDVDTFGLAVTGMVDTPATFSFEEIRNGFPAVSGDMVLQCMTNVHWGRVHITGARLLDVLNHVGIAPEAAKVALHGAEGFATDLHAGEVRQRPDAFVLAYAMNGDPLTPDHGFPLRLAADGKYAYKWCKWLTKIEVVGHDFKGHYEGNRGWSDDATRGRPVQ